MANRAAFNMKEQIEATFDRVTVYNNEIAFRLRGTRGNADTTIMNAVIYDNEYAVRAEDDLTNLEIYNSTFGANNAHVLQFAGGSGGIGTWSWQNNAFVGGRPSFAFIPPTSNLSAQASDFQNLAAADYHLVSSSSLIDKGAALSQVSHDRDGRIRIAPLDIGAYEFSFAGSGKPSAPQNLRVAP